MSRNAGHPVILPLICTLSPLALYLAMKFGLLPDPTLHLHVMHFYLVSAAALLSAAVALVIGVSATRLRNIQVTFLALAFTSLALIFALHGLSTPGFILPANRIAPIAAQLSVMVTSFWLWMSVLSSDHPLVVRLTRFQRYLVPIWGAILAVFVMLVMANPTLLERVPITSAPLKWVVASFSIALAYITVHQYWESYRYSRFPLQLALVYSTGWLIVTQIIMSTGVLFEASWWTYHFLLLGGMGAMVVGLVKQYGLEASLGLVVSGLASASPEARLEAAFTPSVRRLIGETEAKDAYTAGHNYRVALYALRLAQTMGLPPEALRALAQGGVIHDVGKIAVPDEILNKPGKLTPEERAVIEQHPETGFEMCKHLGFLKDELDIIRFHHERWDGNGYPAGLAGEEIPLLARIMAVADVYDALTSERAYRHAWSHEEAQRHLLANAGTQFDPACIEAWMALHSKQMAGRQAIPVPPFGELTGMLGASPAR